MLYAMKIGMQRKLVTSDPICKYQKVKNSYSKYENYNTLMFYMYKGPSYKAFTGVILVDLVLNETLLVRQLLKALLWALRAVLQVLRALL